MLIDVTVKIPEERVGDFYEFVGRWLSEEQSADEVPDASAGLRSWTNSSDDLVLARAVWEKFSPRAKAVFSLLMDQPGHQVSGRDLASTLDIPHGTSGVAGVLAWPARHCAAVNRVGPWRWEYRPEEDSTYYWIEPKVADLFKKVRN